jgi:hypothetical protein
MHMSDSLAFLLIMFLATRFKRRGLKVRTLMEAIAADAMRYFMVIFSAHLVLVLTLNLAPVRTAAPLSGLLPMSSDVLLFRNRSNFFQARKSHTSHAALTNSHYTFSPWQLAAFLCKCYIRFTSHDLQAGFVRYLPVMISRIMLSLKKAADSQQKAWTLTEPTMTGPSFQNLKFFKPRRAANERQRETIPLHTFAESQTVTR